MALNILFRYLKKYILFCFKILELLLNIDNEILGVIQLLFNPILNLQSSDIVK